MRKHFALISYALHRYYCQKWWAGDGNIQRFQARIAGARNPRRERQIFESLSINSTGSGDEHHNRGQH
jgi:hypothetical protein